LFRGKVDQCISARQVIDGRKKSVVMRIFELECARCGALFGVAESTTLPGESTDFTCAVCGTEFAHLNAANHRVCRMLVPADKPVFHLPADAPEPVINL
jgi:hypothetical protein